MSPQTNPPFEAMRQQIETLLDANNLDALRDVLKSAHPADIADMLEDFDEDQRVVIFNALQPEAAAEVLDETSIEITREIVEAVPDETIADLLDSLPMDDAAEVLSELDEEQAEHIIALMQPEDAAEVGILLAYPEETAGRLMNTKIVRLNVDWTVDETLQRLRGVDPEVETLSYLYAVDSADKLVGVVPLRNLITASGQKRIAEILLASVISVRVDTDQEEVARVVSQYDFVAIPVVDAEGKLKGIVTHDDVVDILEEESTEDFQRFGGSEPLEDSYLSTPIFTIVRKRVGWLMILFLTEMLTGTVMRAFEHELQAAVALSFFVPLMIGTGGNSGSQTTSTIIRAMAVGEARFEDTLKLLWHELRVGILLGLAMAALGFLRAITWGNPVSLALTVSLSLFTLVVWANSMGSVLPPIAARLKVDPAIISGPVMSTLVDATGLFIYFSLARIIIGL
jgi:magnesium transporter